VLPVVQNRGVQAELLERFFLPGRPELREAYEAEVRAEAARRLGRDVEVLLYSPARDMQLKEAGTLVRFPGGDDIRELAEFGDSVPRLRDLRDAYPRLWKLYVLTFETDRDVRRRLQEICMAHLPAGCVNALRL